MSPTKHVVGTVDDLSSGIHRVRVAGRSIALFNVDGEFFALRDVCPHQGAELSEGHVVSEVTADRPGDYTVCSDIHYVRCPWHGWEYDLATGQSSYDPVNDRVRAYSAEVEPGSTLLSDGRLSGPYVAETLAVTIENEYVVVQT